MITLYIAAVLLAGAFFVTRSVRNGMRGVEKIESGWWRIALSVIGCSLLTFAILIFALHTNPELPSTSIKGIVLLGVFIFMSTVRKVPPTYAALPDFIGEREEYASGEGPTAIIPGVETLTMASTATRDFVMGDSNLKEPATKLFILTTHDSEAVLLVDDKFESKIDEAYLRILQSIKVNQDAEKKKGYNNIAIVMTPVIRTVNVKNLMSVEGTTMSEKEDNVEKRVAKIIASRARHYAAGLTDDFLIREKDMIARFILEDLNPKTRDFPFGGGATWNQIEAMGQIVTAINISFVDFEDQSIKKAQAQLKVEEAEKKSEHRQIEAVAEQINLLIQLVPGLKGQEQLVADLVQAERKKAIRLVGNMAGSPATLGMFQGMGNPTNPQNPSNTQTPP